MRNVSILIFVIALILGSVTVLMTRNYVNSQRTKPAEVAQAEAQQTMGTLVVTTKALNFGDEIAVENLKEVPWPVDADLRPAKSFSQISEIMTGNRRVAIRSIGDNEPIVADKISGFGYRATLSQVVAPSKRAVAVRLTDVTGVGGFVLPGDRVDVMYTRDDRSRESDRVSHTKLIVRDVRVLAIDQLADESSQGAVLAKTATLEVSSEQAQKLSLAARIGELDLVLRPMVVDGRPLDELTQTINISDLKNENLIPEVVKNPVQKQAPPRRTTKKKAVTAHSDMQVTRGTETTKARVLKSAAPSSVQNSDNYVLAGEEKEEAVSSSAAPTITYQDAGVTP